MFLLVSVAASTATWLDVLIVVDQPLVRRGLDEGSAPKKFQNYEGPARTENQMDFTDLALLHLRLFVGMKRKNSSLIRN
jgi:hypothetical protein